MDISGIFGIPWSSILGLSALILSIVNGFMLLRDYLRDRPILVVRPVHPDVYQWFISLPAGESQGQATRRYGFLAYLDVLNRGLRDVSLDSWCLHLELPDGEHEFRPITIPEPRIQLGQSGMIKAYPLLGLKGEFSIGETMVKSGGSITGFAYYILEYVGNGKAVTAPDGTVTGKVVVSSIFGKKTSTKIVFREISLDKARQVVSNIDKIYVEPF